MGKPPANKTESRALSAPEFRSKITNWASGQLSTWVGEERAREAAGRIAIALSTAAACAKKPDEFYSCTPSSIGAVIAVSALTGIYVGTGATALAYAIPRRPRKGEAPQLTYQLSHRGLNALASRADRYMVATPISYRDTIQVDDDGEVCIVDRDFDNPPITEEEFRGIVLVVKISSTGQVLTRQWLPKKLINERRDTSDSYMFAEKPGNEWAKSSDPWHVWYVPQAMKTAMHYAIARGWCVIDDTEAVRALNADVESDLRQNDSLVIDVARKKGNEGLKDRLGIGETSEAETYVPQSEPEGETVVASGSNSNPETNGGEINEVEAALRQKLDTTTAPKKLEALKREILGAELEKDRKNDLLDELEERLAIATESHE